MVKFGCIFLKVYSMKWQTTTMRGELNDNGILTIWPKEEFKGPETIEQATENLVFLEEEIGIARVKAVMAYLPKHYINVAATRYYRENCPHFPIAFISDSSFKKMLGNMLLNIGNKSRPTRLFMNKEDASEWLDGEMKKREMEESLSGS